MVKVSVARKGWKKSGGPSRLRVNKPPHSKVPRESLHSSALADLGQTPFPTGSESSIIGWEERGPSLPMVARDRHASPHVWLTITGPHPPMFFVSVASTGLRDSVSGLESTLAGTPVSVDFKWVRLATNLSSVERASHAFQSS
jgi:hypothetical protein